MNSDSLFRTMISKTFGTSKRKVFFKKTIYPSTVWYSRYDTTDSSMDFDHEVYSYSIKSGFKKLEVVNFISSNSEDSFSSSITEERAKYPNLAYALKHQSPEAIFIVEIYEAEEETLNDDYLKLRKATVYPVPNWEKYLESISGK